MSTCRDTILHGKIYLRIVSSKIDVTVTQVVTRSKLEAFGDGTHDVQQLRLSYRLFLATMTATLHHTGSKHTQTPHLRGLVPMKL